MIGEYSAFAIQALDGSEKTLESFRAFAICQIWRFIPHLLVNLRQRRSAQTVSACPQVDQYELGLAAISTQLWRQCLARIRYPCKSGNDQGQRRGHRFFPCPCCCQGRTPAPRPSSSTWNPCPPEC